MKNKNFWNTLYILRIVFFFGGGGVLVLEIMKSKTPEFTIKFDQKLGGKDWTEDNYRLDLFQWQFDFIFQQIRF